MNIAIDTNAYSGFMKGDPYCVSVIGQANRIIIPLIVLAELRAGFLGGTRSRKNAETLESFLALPDVSILSPDQLTTIVYAEVFRILRQQGTPIPSNDLWIAALAIQHNIALFSLDAYFDRVPELLRPKLL